MTANQVQYWRNVETERSNRENERLRGGELGVRSGELEARKYEADTNRARQLDDAKTAKVTRGTKIADTITGGIKNLSEGFKNILQPAKGAVDLLSALTLG